MTPYLYPASPHLKRAHCFIVLGASFRPPALSESGPWLSLGANKPFLDAARIHLIAFRRGQVGNQVPHSPRGCPQAVRPPRRKGSLPPPCASRSLHRSGSWESCSISKIASFGGVPLGLFLCEPFSGAGPCSSLMVKSPFYAWDGGTKYQRLPFRPRSAVRLEWTEGGQGHPRGSEGPGYAQGATSTGLMIPISSKRSHRET